MKFIFSSDYYADIGVHVFPIVKYQEVYNRLLAEKCATPDMFLQPMPAVRQDLLLVHTSAYLDDLDACAWTSRNT